MLNALLGNGLYTEAHSCSAGPRGFKLKQHWCHILFPKWLSFIQALIHTLKEIKAPKCLWQDSFILCHSNTLAIWAGGNMIQCGKERKQKMKERITTETLWINASFCFNESLSVYWGILKYRKTLQTWRDEELRNCLLGSKLGLICGFNCFGNLHQF